MATGGIRINFTPKDGGNTFNGTFFTSFANSSMQGKQLTDDLRNAGLSAPSTLRRMWEADPGFGGPLIQDKLWFYATYRYTVIWFIPPGRRVQSECEQAGCLDLRARDERRPAVE